MLLLCDVSHGRFALGIVDPAMQRSDWLAAIQQTTHSTNVHARSQMKKRPVHVVRGAHCLDPAADAAQGAAADARAWVQSVAVCRGSDLAVRPPAQHRVRTAGFSNIFA